MNLRVSSTTLEDFRKWQADLPYMSEQKVIDSIKRVFVPNRKMELGTAFHSILEDPDGHRYDSGYKANGFTFPHAVIEPCLPIFDRRGVFEVKHETEIPIGQDIVTLVNKADQLLGTEIIETKTRWSGFEFDSYHESYQWRCALTVFEDATSVTYNVFELDENDSGVIKLKSINSWREFPYPEMRDDIAELLGRFTEYVHLRGLEPWLQPRAEAA